MFGFNIKYKRHIYVVPFGGICNRMRAIASAYALAIKLNAKLTVVWKKDELLNASYFDLFKAIDGVEFVGKEPKGVDLFIKDQNKLISTQLKLEKKYNTLEEFDNDFCDRFSSLYKSKFKCKRILIRSCYIFDRDADLSIFKPSDLVLERVVGLHIEDYSAVHIRYTDNHIGIERSPLFLFSNKIRELIREGEKVLLCSDECAVTSELKRNFKQLILPERKNLIVDRSLKLSVIDSVVELYLLSMSNQIFGTYWSTFSYTASQIGGVDHNVLSSG